jgi:hypothetical protein
LVALCELDEYIVELLRDTDINAFLSSSHIHKVYQKCVTCVKRLNFNREYATMPVWIRKYGSLLLPGAW